MHRCLQVDDIIHELIRAFTLSRDLKSIAIIARTSTHFYEPAMNALWRRLGGLGPLLECMPANLISETYMLSTWAVPFLEVQACLTREPTSAEWDQMFKHAHRVRELTLGMGIPPTKHRRATTYSATIMASIVKHIQKRALDEKDTAVFPNLMLLRCKWHHGVQGTLACIPHLAGPSIKTVVVNGSTTLDPGEVEPPDAFLATVLTSYPAIQELTVVADSGPAYDFQPYTRTLSDFVKQASDFRVFQSNVPVTTGAISQLIAMPYISTLFVRLTDDLQPLHTRSFAGGLEMVDISARQLFTCANFISAIQSAHLKTINIQVSDTCELAAITRCFKAMQAHTSVSRIRISSNHTYSPDRLVCVIPGTTLTLLYPLSGLQDLVLEEHIEVDLYDQDALALSKAWPCLNNLTFIAMQESIRSNIYAHLTVVGLLHLVRNCKHLRRPGIAFNASNIDANLLDEGINSGPIGENLFMLEVHAPLSPVYHPQKVARFLYTVFPNLRILSFGESDIAMYEGWSDVWSLFRTLLFRRAIL
ncbi:hypothetical protein BDY19DRAFT_990064 [Irpex rosettiformis]|uniref:Uncharacterized protein n=1 Tax=Irpex rosettiformis TaxID=378272 RepID=A0ACB8UGG7_9APHY|nr:hypothetical protein BDY19DRAFT_990064 [Irpex rosettiformis]